MEQDTQELVIKLMAEKIQKLQDNVDALRASRIAWITAHDKLQEELKQLRKKKKTNWQVVTSVKRGRPKGSKNKVRK